MSDTDRAVESTMIMRWSQGKSDPFRFLGGSIQDRVYLLGRKPELLPKVQQLGCRVLSFLRASFLFITSKGTNPLYNI